MNREPPLRARAERLASCVAAAVALTPVIYQIERLIEHLRSPEPDPSVLLWSERSRLLERVGVTGYVVVALALLVAPRMARRPALPPRLFDACVLLGLVAGLAGGALR